MFETIETEHSEIEIHNEGTHSIRLEVGDSCKEYLNKEQVEKLIRALKAFYEDMEPSNEK